MRPLPSLDRNPENKKSLLSKIGIPIALVVVGMGVENIRTRIFSTTQDDPVLSQKLDESTLLSQRITHELDEYEQFLDEKANGHVYLLAIERHMDGLASFLETMIARKKFATRTLDNVNSAQISISYSPEEVAKIPDEELQEMAKRAREISNRASARMEHLPPIDVPPGGGGGFF